MRPRFRLATFLLLVLVIGSSAGLLAIALRTPPDPHAHAGGGYVLHNESEWPVVLRVEHPQSGPRYVRLGAGESLGLPSKPSQVAVMLRGSGPPHASGAHPAIFIEPDHDGRASDDHGAIEIMSPRCLAVRMRLGRGFEPPVE